MRRKETTYDYAVVDVVSRSSEDLKNALFAPMACGLILKWYIFSLLCVQLAVGIFRESICWLMITGKRSAEESDDGQTMWPFSRVAVPNISTTGQFSWKDTSGGES